MVAPLGALIDKGVDVLSTVLDATTKRIFAYLGDVKAEDGDSDRAEWIQWPGFVSRPGKAIAGKSAAQAVRVRCSGGDVIVACRDARTLEMYGQLDDGETGLCAGGPDGTAQGRILIKKDGSVNAYTRVGNTSGGAGMVIQIDPANNAIRILNGDGHGIIIDSDGVKITAKNAGITLGADGSAKVIATAQAQLDGASIMIGSVAVPGVTSALHGPTGLAGTASLKVNIE